MPERRFERYLVAANRAIIFVMMALMATLVFVNVVTRYGFNFSIIWAEEVSQYLMIWIAYLGAVTVLGFRFVVFVWNQETPVLNISLGIPSLAIPIGALLFALHLLFMFRNYVERRYAPGHILEDLRGEEA